MIGDLVRGQIANSFHEIQEQTVGFTENTKIKNKKQFLFFRDSETTRLLDPVQGIGWNQVRVLDVLENVLLKQNSCQFSTILFTN